VSLLAHTKFFLVFNQNTAVYSLENSASALLYCVVWLSLGCLSAGVVWRKICLITSALIASQRCKAPSLHTGDTLEFCYDISVVVLNFNISITGEMVVRWLVIVLTDSRDDLSVGSDSEVRGTSPRRGASPPLPAFKRKSKAVRVALVHMILFSSHQCYNLVICNKMYTIFMHEQ
jgi:hypothetical protein